MRSTAFRLAALLWVVGFFVVFMPAHRRGIVQLPGAEHVVLGEGESARPYCPLCVMVTGGMSEEDRPPADAPVNCAVCFLKAGLDLPPAVIEAPRFVAELDYLTGRLDVGRWFPLATQERLRGRGPPPAVCV